MSKERLEEIDKRAKHRVLENIRGEVRYRLTEINTEDYEWLIEQAERVQELEKQIADDEHFVAEILEQNRRYRAALEFYADRENYEPDHYDPDTHDYTSMIDHDKGATARKALEESK